ncbi:MAG TPA: YihY/virulence factor BrkB family protein [Acidimicrobiales bacterium]
MNPLERAVWAVDKYQQRHTPLAFVVAVVRKFGDDRGGTLATSLTYSAFVAVFPLLLLFVTILGFVLGSNQDADDAVLRSALVEFPILGDQLVSSLRPLRGSGFALAVGLVGLAWGGFGVTQAAQHAMAEVWNVPGVLRPNFVVRIARGVVVLGIGGLGLVATSALASVSTFTGELTAARLAAGAAAALLNVFLFVAAFRMTTVRTIATRQLLAGAAIGGLAWTLLQALGGYLVSHQLRNSSEVYGFFATVLGLLSWIFLGTRVVLYAAEANVVLARRLWPRSLVQPPLTPADKQALADIVRQEERRPEESVDVSFEVPEDPAVHAEAPARTEQRGS